MLVLSRRQGENILIQVGDAYVWLTVTSIEMNASRPRVKLGFIGSEDVVIRREELLGDNDPPTPARLERREDQE